MGALPPGRELRPQRSGHTRVSQTLFQVFDLVADVADLEAQIVDENIVVSLVRRSHRGEASAERVQIDDARDLHLFLGIIPTGTTTLAP